MATADGRYDSRPWNSSMDPGPNESNEERLVTNSLLGALQTPAVAIRTVPEEVLFRTRFGYRTRSLSVSDIIDVDRIYGDGRVNFSGGPASFSGTSRNDLGAV